MLIKGLGLAVMRAATLALMPCLPLAAHSGTADLAPKAPVTACADLAEADLTAVGGPDSAVR